MPAGGRGIGCGPSLTRPRRPRSAPRRLSITSAGQEPCRRARYTRARHRSLHVRSGSLHALSYPTGANPTRPRSRRARRVAGRRTGAAGRPALTISDASPFPGSGDPSPPSRPRRSPPFASVSTRESSPSPQPGTRSHHPRNSGGHLTARLPKAPDSTNPAGCRLQSRRRIVHGGAPSPHTLAQAHGLTGHPMPLGAPR